jgi:pyrroloquinoline quinone (PQQ) biosynthesis protein C
MKEVTMPADQLHRALIDALRDRRLLDHPFYTRWEAGSLHPGELGAYAAQYRHFETALPDMLQRLLPQLSDGAARMLIAENLADELGNPEPHVGLFDGFAIAVGAPAAAPATPATTALLDTYAACIDEGGAQGLAAIVAYEMQAPEIAASKAAGLRRHYGLDASATRFWDLHATMDERHAEWAVEALAALPAAPETVLVAARRAADAWWSFLDEREAAAAVHA